MFENHGSAFTEYLRSLKNPDIESYRKIYKLKEIIEASKVHKHISKRYDILLGIIFLYRGSMDTSEIVTAIDKDWDIQMNEREIENLLTSYRTRRCMAQAHKFYVINSNTKLSEEQKKYLIDVNGVFDVIHHDHESFFNKNDFLDYSQKSGEMNTRIE